MLRHSIVLSRARLSVSVPLSRSASIPNARPLFTTLSKSRLISGKAIGSSATTLTMEAESMSDVQRRLMFDDECILVDKEDNVIGHDSKYNCE